MNPPRWERLESLFARVMEAGSEGREQLLRAAGREDAALEGEVRQLLAVYEEDSQYLETMPSTPGVCLFCGHV